jgi:hypothetical protein
VVRARARGPLMLDLDGDGNPLDDYSPDGGQVSADDPFDRGATMGTDRPRHAVSLVSVGSSRRGGVSTGPREDVRVNGRRAFPM